MAMTSFAFFTRHSRAALCAGALLSLTSTVSLADQRCQQLEALHRQYIGVSLTSDQQRLKRRLVSWYNSHCRSRRAAR
jgi:hypothetical protein